MSTHTATRLARTARSTRGTRTSRTAPSTSSSTTCATRSDAPRLLARRSPPSAASRPGNQLFLEVPGPGGNELVAPDRSLDPKSGMRFYDVPAGNLG